ncbi:hemerythrin domain-containing protein [Candidatus Nitrospira allomarina]|jgi:regulator of cell morphogenesis and NO signaling|uniref:Hemerythrin domain-containing protein n=1 Tax=Candidatus Nitrospira allomarina TaxID=3020900 RepID=A0AA96JTW5_9BACT|nr:hemerythrin domain-containing protein [Candidatus Nitrospira allomarina]WNM59565.1 hemerythrin domain-containing protein [Candidatus Nitrospira allomarina]
MATNTIAEFMGHDHDRLDEIFTRFQAFKKQDSQKARLLFQELFTGLHRHIRWEEEILFPVFETQAEMVRDHGPTGVMRIEHRQIKDFLEQIQAKIAEGDFATEEAEVGLLQVLTAHSVKEEKILYPWIDNCVRDEERASLLARMGN